jgi:ribosomal protein S18 acetylase RimI-like enzyme
VAADKSAEAPLTPGGDVAVRKAAPADAEPIASLIDELGYPVTAPDVEARLRLVEEAGHCVLVGELDGQVIGCLSTSVMHVLHRPAPVGRISMMVVDERHRGRGIGATMIREAERLLAANGCQLVEVTSNNRRTDAHRFWESNGYERTSSRFAKDVSKPDC